jgi:hypothetical protein
MDDRTARMLGALDPVGVSLLLELLPGPRTEVELLAAADEPGQSTGNRRLHRLRQAGLVAQEAGDARAPGRLWSVAHPAETETLLCAVLALSEAIDAKDRTRRAQAARKLRRARAKRLGIRSVSDQSCS